MLGVLTTGWPNVPISLLRSSAMMTRTLGGRAAGCAWAGCNGAISTVAATHQPKAEIRRSTAHLRFAAAADQVARAILIRAQIGSAFQHALRGTGLLRIDAVAWSRRIVRDLPGLRKHGVV